MLQELYYVELGSASGNVKADVAIGSIFASLVMFTGRDQGGPMSSIDGTLPPLIGFEDFLTF